MKLEHVDGSKKTGKILFELGILIMIVNLVCSFGIWQAIMNGWKIVNGGSLCLQAYIQSYGIYFVEYLNQESLYTLFLSFLFSFLGNKEEVVPVINLIFQLGGIFCFYFGVKKVTGLVGSILVIFIGTLSSLLYYPVVIDDSMHGIWFCSGVIFWIGIWMFFKSKGKLIWHICLGLLVGVYSYIDVTAFALMIFFVIMTLLYKETLKKGMLQLLGYFLGWINSFFVMFYLWNAFIFSKEKFLYWYYDKIKLMFSLHRGGQYISILSIMVVTVLFCVLYKIRNHDMENVNLLPNTNKVENISNTESIKNIENIKITENISNAEKISDTGNAVISTDIPDKPVIKFIENPLPLPKKHVKKEMTYAFEPTKDQMHYDLNNYRVDDDYDIKEQ